ncbi:hypothetical protein D3C81_1796190 [compost metagenome]
MNHDVGGGVAQAMIVAQAFLYARAGPALQAALLAELRQGEYARRGDPIAGGDQYLHGLHDVRKRLGSCGAQPVGQVFFQQQAVSRVEQGLLAGFSRH